MLVTFLLDYMAARRNMSSIDVAVDRYRRSFPDEIWVLPWRLAADASRKVGFINLVSASPTEENFYNQFRLMARSELSWRALHDSAMFAVLVSEELQEAARAFPGGEGSSDPLMAEAGILAILESAAKTPSVAGTPFADRIDYLARTRPELQDEVRSLRSAGRSGRTAGAQASVSLTALSETLLNNALDDLSMALQNPDHPGGSDRSDLLFLEAHVLRKTGRQEESINKAQSALELNPDNARANELLLNEGAY
jgi:tetratricopeptide (TPR) repeat protein